MCLAEKVISNEITLAERISVVGDDIVIHKPVEYYINFSRCDTPEKILSWVLQLTEKTWMTRDIVHQFVILACQNHSIERVHI